MPVDPSAASERASTTARASTSDRSPSDSDAHTTPSATPASSSRATPTTPVAAVLSSSASQVSATDAAASASNSVAASKKGGISSGAIAAIVVVIALVAIGLIAILGRIAYKKRKASKAGAGWQKTDDDLFGMSAEKAGSNGSRGMDGSGNRLQYAAKNEPMSWGGSSFGNRDCNNLFFVSPAS
jgi:type IV secretory pathway VirB2 component (pilin)